MTGDRREASARHGMACAVLNVRVGAIRSGMPQTRDDDAESIEAGDTRSC